MTIEIQATDELSVTKQYVGEKTLKVEKRVHATCFWHRWWKI